MHVEQRNEFLILPEYKLNYRHVDDPHGIFFIVLYLVLVWGSADQSKIVPVLFSIHLNEAC